MLYATFNKVYSVCEDPIPVTYNVQRTTYILLSTFCVANLEEKEFEQ